MKTKIFLTTLLLAVFSACSSKTSQQESAENNQETTQTVAADNQFDFMLGTYELSKDEMGAEACNMKLILEKNDDKYQYHLTTSKRDLKGEAIVKEDDAEQVWVILPKIQWDDYQGEIAEGEEDKERDPKPTTQDVEFMYDKDNNSLTMQNYGNNMNFYVIFGECDIKYISLNRIK